MPPTRLNAGWHHDHPMPPNATLQQRIDWHLEHAAACACRGIPENLKALVEARRSELAAEREPRSG